MRNGGGGESLTQRNCMQNEKSTLKKFSKSTKLYLIQPYHQQKNHKYKSDLKAQK